MNDSPPLQCKPLPMFGMVGVDSTLNQAANGWVMHFLPFWLTATLHHSTMAIERFIPNEQMTYQYSRFGCAILSFQVGSNPGITATICGSAALGTPNMAGSRMAAISCDQQRVRDGSWPLFLGNLRWENLRWNPPKPPELVVKTMSNIDFPIFSHQPTHWLLPFVIIRH